MRRLHRRATSDQRDQTTRSPSSVARSRSSPVNRPRTGCLSWRHAALAAAVAAALALLPSVAQAQPTYGSGAGSGAAASSPAKPSTEPPSAAANNPSNPSAPASTSSDTSEKAKVKVSGWGDKIKETSARLIDTTKQVFSKLAEKIPGTDAYTRAKGGSSGSSTSQHSSSVRP